MRSDFAFQILRFDMFAAREDPQRVLTEVASLCRRFHIRFIGADGGGNGHVYNPLAAALRSPAKPVSANKASTFASVSSNTRSSSRSMCIAILQSRLAASGPDAITRLPCRTQPSALEEF
jgi:hypothetical protein